MKVTTEQNLFLWEETGDRGFNYKTGIYLLHQRHARHLFTYGKLTPCIVLAEYTWQHGGRISSPIGK